MLIFTGPMKLTESETALFFGDDFETLDPVCEASVQQAVQHSRL